MREGGGNGEASVNPLMKKNNKAVKASQEQVKHSRWGSRSVKAKGQRSTSRPRSDPDLWGKKRVAAEEIQLLGLRRSSCSFTRDSNRNFPTEN